MQAEAEILHRDDDIEVARLAVSGAGRQRRTPIVFSAEGAGGGEAQRLGEALFAQAGLTAYHIRARRNHWWHAPSVRPQLENIAREVLEPFFYGASMGAYGALHWSGMLGLTSVAFAPQVAVSIETMREDRRWWDQRAALRPVFDETALLTGRGGGASCYVLLDRDAAATAPHLKLLEDAAAGCVVVDVPHAGADVHDVLTQAGVTRQLAVTLALGAAVDEEGLRNVAAQAFLRHPDGILRYLRRTASTPDAPDARDADILLRRAEGLVESGLEQYETAYLLAERFAATGQGAKARRWSWRSVDRHAAPHILLKHAEILRAHAGNVAAWCFLEGYRGTNAWSEAVARRAVDIAARFPPDLRELVDTDAPITHPPRAS